MITRAICFVGRDPDVRAEVVDLGRTQQCVTEHFDSVAQLAESGVQLHEGCLLIELDQQPDAQEALAPLVRDGRVSVPIIVVMGRASTPAIVRAMQRGAAGCVEKPCDQTTIAAAMQAALDYGQSERSLRQQYGSFVERLSHLTHPEREVMRRMVEGKPNKQIAAELDNGLRTIELRRARVLEKMHAKTLADLVRIVTEAEMIRHWILKLPDPPSVVPAPHIAHLQQTVDE